MKNIFNSILLPKVKTNRFDLTHDVKMSFDMGELVPTCCLEAIPGDRWDFQVQNMLRFAPLIAPVMHRVRVTTHYFFIPLRLLWPDFQYWITGESEVEAPYVTMNSTNAYLPGSASDYLGLPTETLTLPVRCTPFALAAYRLVYDEYYRDQNLQVPVFVVVVPGDNTSDYGPLTDTAPLRRAWQHDYFTAALPFAQKGDAVQIPLVVQDDIPVELIGTPTGVPGIMKDATDYTLPGVGDIDTQAGPVPLTESVHSNSTPSVYDPNGSLVVDVQADATDINTLRRAFRLQEWLERNARGGTRYVENILSHFGVRSSDARLNRPEYIGGSKQNMVISEVLSTAQSNNDIETAEIPVGQMAGHGISVGGSNNFRYRCEEHGIILGIINVQPDTAYQQGLHRQFSRFDRLDYAWPTFANIGEQEVLNKEVYVAHSQSQGVFGYVPRYAEYKFANSRVAGEMKSSLAFWHLGRIFSSEPALNSSFITANPSNRIFAVEGDSDHIYAHIFNRISVQRKLPRYGIPQL